MQLPHLQQPRHDIWVNTFVFFIALGSLFVISRYLGADTLRAWVEAAGIWAPAAFVFAKASTIVIAPLAGSFLYPLGGASFGLWYGVALAAVGDAIGSAIAFWISRRFGRPFAEKFLGGESSLLGNILATIGTIRGFLIARVILITAHDLLAYAAGLTKLPFIPFIFIHIGVSLIPTIILTGVGTALFADMSGGLTVGYIFGGIMGIGLISSLAFAAYAYFTQVQEKARPGEGAL